MHLLTWIDGKVAGFAQHRGFVAFGLGKWIFNVDHQKNGAFAQHPIAGLMPIALGTEGCEQVNNAIKETVEEAAQPLIKAMKKIITYNECIIRGEINFNPEEHIKILQDAIHLFNMDNKIDDSIKVMGKEENPSDYAVETDSAS
jgi:hypothetical protein